MNVKIRQNIVLQAVEIQRRVNDDIIIGFLEDGIHFKSVSMDHVEMLVSFISTKVCDGYRLGNTGELEIGIDVTKLRDFLKLGKKDDIFVFDYDPDNCRLIVKLGYLTCAMGLISVECIENVKVPRLELKNRVLVNTKMFYDTLKNVLYEPIKDDTGKEKFKQFYNGAFLTILQNRIILENLCSFDEDRDRKNRGCIIADTNILTVVYGNSATTAFSDEVFKHLQIFKKNWEHVTVETDYFHPIRISGDNGFVQFEYWRAPAMPDEIDRTEFDKVQKEAMGKKEVKTGPEVKDLKAKAEVVEKVEPKPEIKETVKPVVKPICKPKRQLYNKYQWSQDMEIVKDKIEKHRFNRGTERDQVKKTVEYQGFVFFINVPKFETELSYVKIKNKDAAKIIQKVLPEKYVLIAWYKWSNNGWVAQAVKKVS